MTTALEIRPKIAASIADYAVLKRKVRDTLLLGQQKIEQQKVRTYLETGKHLHEHIFFHETRKEHYGKEVIIQLAEDLEVSDDLLYQCLRFYRAYKKIFDARQISLSLTWAHLRAAMRIADEKKRLTLIKEAAKKGWNSRRLEIEVRNHNYSQHVLGSAGQKPPRLPLVCLGPFYTFKIIRPESIGSRAKEMLIDLGFSHRLETGLFPQTRFAADTIVTSVKKLKSYSFTRAAGADEGMLYTFQAYVERVIDGDTLKLEFQLGLGCWHEETIRLNTIDCPEIDTPEGKAAKKFVESELSGCEFVTVKSIRTRKEKWGRYLGDIFYAKKGNAAPIYLNQLLLDKGHAVRIRQ